jgi:competence protein ComEC
LRADLVLMPHHGSKTSSTAAWVQAVQPAVAIAQSGYRNRFGHPHPAGVQRYQAQGARTVTSAGCGAAQWRSWAPGAVQCERTLARRYWQHAVPEAAGAGYTE